MKMLAFSIDNMWFKEGTFSGQFPAFLPGNIDTIVITICIFTAVK